MDVLTTVFEPEFLNYPTAKVSAKILPAKNKAASPYRHYQYLEEYPGSIAAEYNT
jgi:hypothetical protein